MLSDRDIRRFLESGDIVIDPSTFPSSSRRLWT